MVVLSTRTAMLGSTELRGVQSIVVNRTAGKVAVEHTDMGAHAGFVDVPERRTTVVLRRTVEQDEASPALPGDSVTFSFRVGESATPPRLRLVSTTVVVTSVTHEVFPGRSVIQTISMTGWSSDGIADPISESLV